MTTTANPRVLIYTRQLLSFFFWVVALAGVGAIVIFVAVTVAPDKATLSPKLSFATSREAAVHAAQLGALGGAAVTTLIMLILRQLRRLVDSTIAGDPFVPENGRRLRHLAWLFFGVDVLSRVTLMSVTGALKVEGAPLTLPFSFAGLLMVMMTLVLAHIFEQGTRLRADVQGTV